MRQCKKEQESRRTIRIWKRRRSRRRTNADDTQNKNGTITREEEQDDKITRRTNVDDRITKAETKQQKEKGREEARRDEINTRGRE